MLIGCTREQLEDHEFKNTELEEEWKVYTINSYRAKSNTNLKGILTGPYSTEEEAKKVLIKHFGEECHIETYILTPRLLLQIIGTECIRDKVHPNAWVNALFADYKAKWVPTGDSVAEEDVSIEKEYPNWIITDVRFPNELEAIKKRGGISIRVNRNPINITVEGQKLHVNQEDYNKHILKKEEHPSETALDNAEFDYIIENNSSIEDLIHTVSLVLKREKII